jgi:hypothetical protein
MCKAFAFRFSTETTADKNLTETVDSQVDIGDDVAGFGWIGSTKKPRLPSSEFMRLLQGKSAAG